MQIYLQFFCGVYYAHKGGGGNITYNCHKLEQKVYIYIVYI